MLGPLAAGPLAGLKHIGTLANSLVRPSPGLGVLEFDDGSLMTVPENFTSAAFMQRVRLESNCRIILLSNAGTQPKHFNTPSSERFLQTTILRVLTKCSLQLRPPARFGSRRRGAAASAARRAAPFRPRRPGASRREHLRPRGIR